MTDTVGKNFELGVWKPSEDLKRHNLIEEKKGQILSFFGFHFAFFFSLCFFGVIPCRTSHRVGFYSIGTE